MDDRKLMIHHVQSSSFFIYTSLLNIDLFEQSRYFPVVCSIFHFYHLTTRLEQLPQIGESCFFSLY